MINKTIIVWIDSESELPKDNEKVLVIHDGELKTARFKKGISAEERERMRRGEIDNPSEQCWNLSYGYKFIKRSELIDAADEAWNNKKPYGWEIGSHTVFGQNIRYWSHFSKPILLLQEDEQ